MSQLNWRKSTFSENQANCVELAAAHDGIHIRESDEPDTVIHTRPATIRSFIRAVRATRLDHIL
ncbi:hypothetical protein GCM10009548_80530 [Streptomyces malaysiensis subsp. malaysiensis]|uniref:DUF397 domain-containing protein n=1 Tax=Streptomyces malaysiensis TaxID=92644 RepID=A0ABX6W8I7_STRMQ|nr:MULTISPECIES: DUF397 domain-containing protein [Streptomyces]QPI57790.1 DUF397 domain-containing protein [Streptomyces solisilvae]UHH19352.1 DUF397 domain-containing protein [Streptomyces sp. HNM0561]